MESEIYAFGEPRNSPNGASIDLVGLEQLGAPRCHEPVQESVLREIRKDATGRIRALAVTWSDLTDGDRSSELRRQSCADLPRSLSGEPDRYPRAIATSVPPRRVTVPTAVAASAAGASAVPSA